MKITILIPTRDRHGLDLPTSEVLDTIEWIQEEITGVTGGCTLGPECVGSWRNSEGLVISETVRPIWTHTYDSWKVDAVRVLAARLRDRLNQDCVLFTISQDEFSFI